MTKILLVEDNEMNRDMLLRRLKRRGFEVNVAVDGAESIEMVQRDPPDLILMDMSLPVMDGYQATRILKENPDTRSIPVLGLSAHAMTGDAERALDAGCDDYDTKPVEMKRLLGKIDLLLESSAGVDPAEPTAASVDPTPPPSAPPPRSAGPPPPPPPPPPASPPEPPPPREPGGEDRKTSRSARTYSTVPLPPIPEAGHASGELHRTVVLPSDWDETSRAGDEGGEGAESDNDEEERQRPESGPDDG